MDYQLSANWEESFEVFLSGYDDVFMRSETREKAKLYIRGLLADVERKNGWQLAEALNLPNPHPLQRLLNEAKWESDVMQQGHRQRIMEKMSDKGVLAIDESGFIKKGKASVGVSRQYCGRIGKVDNCQVGVYVVYATPTGTAFVDRRLYLPKGWCEDGERRQQVGIPDDITFQTKPQLAQQMLQVAWDEGIDVRYVTGDTLYGNSPDLRTFIDNSDHFYVLGIGSNHHADYKGIRQALSHLIHRIPDDQWQQLAMTLAETGWVGYDWVAVRVTLDKEATDEQWLLIRRSLSEATEFDFFVSNAPDDTALTELAAVASMRHEIEQAFEEAKGQLGLADYEVRTWHGWHRHMTLCFLAHLWLTLLSIDEREKKATTSMDEL